MYYFAKSPGFFWFFDANFFMIVFQPFQFPRNLGNWKGEELKTKKSKLDKIEKFEII